DIAKGVRIVKRQITIGSHGWPTRGVGYVPPVIAASGVYIHERQASEHALSIVERMVYLELAPILLLGGRTLGQVVVLVCLTGSRPIRLRIVLLSSQRNGVHPGDGDPVSYERVADINAAVRRTCRIGTC